ncbi:MAG: hypothetical protein M1817_004772 [Caeruleum heppii]|nr:MAG: hypothetical protein M1817_004772 [Caeruleum heppii]
MHASSWVSFVLAALLLRSVGACPTLAGQASGNAVEQYGQPRPTQTPTYALPAGHECPSAGEGLNRDSLFNGRPILNQAMLGLAGLLNTGQQTVGYLTSVQDPEGGPDTFALFSAQIVPGTSPKIPLPNIFPLFSASIIQRCYREFFWFKPTTAGRFQRPELDIHDPNQKNLQFGFQTSNKKDLPCSPGACIDASD